MKKGFTLIELLAVIVILAIIAIIATPIILNIINDAKEESQERSIELYASAAKNAVAKYQLNNTGAPTSFDQLDIEYDGNVACITEELYGDGSIYLAGCTVNGDAVEYTYGTQQVTQVYKPQYYYFGYDWTGTVGTTAAPVTPSSVPPEDKTVYLGYDVTDGVVSTAYACFVRNETEYCLKGTADGSAYEINKNIQEDAFKDIEGACTFNSERSFYYCNAGLNVVAGTIGHVITQIGLTMCVVDTNGYFECYEK